MLVICNISLSSFYFGYTIIYLSVIDFQVVMNIFAIDLSRNFSEGLLTSCVPIGGLLGAYVSYYFIKSLSRKYLLSHSEPHSYMSTTWLSLSGFSFSS